MILGHNKITNPCFAGNATGWTVGAAWLYPTTGALNTTFTNATSVISRAAGSFLANGFLVGNIIYTTSTNNPGPFTIAGVVALEITVSETLTDEGPVSVVTKSDQCNKFQDGVTTLAQNANILAGNQYILQYEVKNYAVANVTASIGGVSDSARTADGAYEMRFTASNTDNLVFTPLNGGRLCIDNVSVQEILKRKIYSFPTFPNIPNIGGI